MATKIQLAANIVLVIPSTVYSRHEVVGQNSGDLYGLSGEHSGRKFCGPGGLDGGGTEQRVAAHGGGRNDISAFVDQDLDNDGT